MLVGAAMALDAIGEVANTFLDMLTPDIFRSVLMATIAGVLAVVVAQIAGHAARFVMPVEHESLVMIETGRDPFILTVALPAIAGDLAVQRIGWRFVATFALATRRLLQQGMIG